MLDSEQPRDTVSHTPRVRHLGEPEQVPVYSCHVAVAPPSDGIVVARLLNLDGLQGQGGSEREALQDLVAKFKLFATQVVADGKKIPWLAEASQPQPGEQQRWIAVHL